jgi:imidazole glycerol phosphate synthase subunit HisF
MINLVGQNIAIPLIVGGGIVDFAGIQMLMMQALI